MTEYWTKDGIYDNVKRTGWMETAMVMHKSLVVENVVAYVYWGIPWPMGKDNVGGKGRTCQVYLFCMNATGADYQVNHMVYALSQYSRFVRPGWKRIEVASNE